MAMTMRRNRARARLPIINPAAVAQYLGRELEDHDWMKGADRDELYDAARELGHRFATDPWTNQLVCFLLGTEYPGFCFFAKQGGGKSFITLNLIRYRKRKGQLVRALVLVPELLHVRVWEDQLREHAPDLTYRLLLGDKQERIDLLDSQSDVCVMNYKGLEVYMTELIPGIAGKPGRRAVDPKLASEFAAQFNFVAFDESHRLGNHQSLVYECCTYLSSAADYRYALTGTPFGRDPKKLWPQFMLVDHGETLGRTLGMFRSAFFTAREDYWSGVTYEFNPRMLGELNRVIKHRSITFALDEIRDMPPKLSVRLPVQLGKEARQYYDRILQGVKEARGDYASLGNLFVRMRQCASGFLALRADDESQIKVKFKRNDKLEALREFILDKEDKLLVFHEYILSGLAIEAMLIQEKIGFAALRGDVKNPAAQYERFLTDPRCRVFVLQNQLGSEAINPQYVCRRAVFYESPVSPITRDQAEGRVFRPGQTGTTFIYDLIAQDTVEEKVLRYVKEGRDLLKAVLSGRETLEG